MTDELPLTSRAQSATRDDIVTGLFRTGYRSPVGMARLLVDREAEEVVRRVSPACRALTKS